MTEPQTPLVPLAESPEVEISGLEISPAWLGEMPQILAWNAQTWEEHASRQPANFPPETLGALQEAIRASFRGKGDPKAESDRILAARIAGHMVGYMIFSSALGKSGVTRVGLDDICVDPAFRGHGIGGLLLARAVQEKDRNGWESLTAFTWGGNDAGAATFAGSAFRQDFTHWRLGTSRRAAPPSPWPARLMQVFNVLGWMALGLLAGQFLFHLLR